MLVNVKTHCINILFLPKMPLDCEAKFGQLGLHLYLCLNKNCTLHFTLHYNSNHCLILHSYVCFAIMMKKWTCCLETSSFVKIQYLCKKLSITLLTEVHWSTSTALVVCLFVFMFQGGIKATGGWTNLVSFFTNVVRYDLGVIMHNA